MKYVLKIETDNSDVYKHICKVLGVDVQEHLMKLGNEKSTFEQEIFITEKEKYEWLNTLKFTKSKLKMK